MVTSLKNFVRENSERKFYRKIKFNYHKNSYYKYSSNLFILQLKIRNNMKGKS